MAWKIIRKKSMADGYTSSNIMDIMIDNEQDIQSLPKECAEGSVAYTADNSIVYRLDQNDNWVLVTGNGAGGSGGGSSESVMEALIQTGVAPTIMDYDGSLLADGDGAILFNL